MKGRAHNLITEKELKALDNREQQV